MDTDLNNTLATNIDSKVINETVEAEPAENSSIMSTNTLEGMPTDENEMETVEIVVELENHESNTNLFNSPTNTNSNNEHFQELEAITDSNVEEINTQPFSKQYNFISDSRIGETFEDECNSQDSQPLSFNDIQGPVSFSDLKLEPSTSNNRIKPETVNEEHLQFSTSNTNVAEGTKSNRFNLYAPDTGPQMYQAKGNLVTRPIVTKNLPQVFQCLPIFGKPAPGTSLQEFYTNKVKEFIGYDLNDEEFEDLENYCSPELLKTGNEIKMQTSVPVMGLLTSNVLHNKFTMPDVSSNPPNLVTLKKFKLRLEKDTKGLYIKRLKYRGARMLPYAQETTSEESNTSASSSKEPDEELEPGVDILYRVRIYRPYTYNMIRDRYTRSRHSVFCCDVLVSGRHKLTALRDRFVCHNDFDLRVDVSNHPDMLPSAKAKEVFPSGFLFINNVFYVDTREGCIDYSVPIREWARRRKLGDFPRKDMCQVRIDQLVLKLGYPEVYVHQGNCEHVFLFSEVRLLNPSDPLRMSGYPCSTAIGQNQTVYCTTCAEFSAKWIVVGSERVPFDPGFFCDTCFKQYMYKDGQKIGHFKAYRYRGNALNILKPL